LEQKSDYRHLRAETSLGLVSAGNWSSFGNILLR
jgi:hypothetical protein